MAIYYVDDLYPRTAPKAGTRIQRFTQLQLGEYFHQRNGTGAGKIAIRADEADGDALDPRGLQYVRVRRVNDAVVDGATLSGFSEKVVGGFFLEEGDFLAIDTKQQRLLSFGGAGTLAYLDRAQMASHTYVYDIFTGMDPFDGTWRLWNQSTIYAGGDFLGAILWRIVYEAQHFRVGTTPYTHRHGDGTDHTDIHHDDRLVSAIPDIVMTFTGSVDSSGNPWTVESGEFTAQVGESVLDVTKRLMEAGLYVELNPDTFELNAWEIANHGRDRTGLAWGTNVVRFEPPTDQNQTNGNILNDLKRAIRAIIRRTWLLAGSSNDQYGDAHAGGDVKWEGFYPSEVGVKSALEAVAARQIQARNDAGDTVRVHIHVANDPSNGSYLPGEHVTVDDTVILHTGTDPWDWNEAAYPVAQWGIKTRRAGDTDAFVDLGSMYFSTADRQFQAPGGPGKHTHPPNPRLCDPSTPCNSLTASDLTAATATNGDVEAGASTQWTGGAVESTARYAGANSYAGTGTTVTLDYDYDPAQVFTAGVRYVLDQWDRRDANSLSHTRKFGMAGGDEATSSEAALESGTGVDGQAWVRHRICWTPSADRTGVRFTWTETQDAAEMFAIDGLVLYTADDDLLAGTSPRAARCDHGHHAREIVLNGTAAGLTADNVQEGFEELAALIGSGDFVEKINGGNETKRTVAASGAAHTFDLSLGNHQDITLTDDCVFTMPPPGAGKSFTHFRRQDGTGGHDSTYTDVEWPGASEPVWSTAPSAVDIVAFVSDGTVWYGIAGSSPAAVVAALDDLTDVTITSPATGDRLRHNGSEWANSSLIWRPVMAQDPSDSKWYVVVDGVGNAVMAEG